MYKLVVVQDNSISDVNKLNDFLDEGWEIETTIPRPFAIQYIIKTDSKPESPLKFPLCNPMSYRGDIDSNKSDDICVAKMVPIGSLIVTPDHRAFSVSK